MRKPFLLTLLFLVGCGVTFPTNGPVHWHATVELNICGDLIDLPRIPPGQGHLGASLLHTHDDNIIHVEGVVQRPEDITVGRFFRSIGMDVTSESVGEYGKTLSCGGSGQLTAYVNGEEDPDFLDHSVRDGDVIQLMFG
ncbi:hypothetical protein HY493_01155 [Candidatus Woesearchaeota archaeon]|nr:hypothetical protein [Candidatus Woesearchaeota archaeon]